MRLMDAIARGGISTRFWQAFLNEVDALSPADLEAVMRAVMAIQVPYQAQAQQQI